MSRHTGFEVAKKTLSVQAILEWAFRVEKVSLDLPKEFEELLGRSYGRGTWARFEKLEALGCHIDGGGVSDKHEDAETVAAIVSGLTDQCGGKFMAIRVAEYARAGTTPDWMPGAKPRMIAARMKGDGMAHTEVCDYATVPFRKTDKTGRTRTRYRREEVRCCPVVMSPSQGQIDRARNFYFEWWLALSELRRCLQVSQQLRRHIVNDQMPMKAPWERERGGLHRET